MITRTLVVKLCDDMEYVHDNIQKLLFRYQDETKINVKLLHCYSGEELLKSNDDYDILLLDIELEGIDGIEAGRRLREQNKDCKIIMLSAAEYRYKDAFKIQAFRFISKPVDYSEFKNAIDDVALEIFDKTTIDVVIDNVHCEIRMNDIIYFDVKGSYIEVHLANGKNGTINTSMSKLENLLDETVFVRANRNITVNLNYAEDIDKTTLVLHSGEGIPISSRRYLSVKKAFVEFDLR